MNSSDENEQERKLSKLLGSRHISNRVSAEEVGKEADVEVSKKKKKRLLIREREYYAKAQEDLDIANALGLSEKQVLDLGLRAFGVRR